MACVLHNIIIVVCGICSTSIVVLCKSGTFTVLQGHSTELISCARSVLKKNEYIAARVSESTGACEGLSYEWDPSTGLVAGYSYALKKEILETFDPKVEIEEGTQKGFDWTVPGVFKEGAKVEVELTLPNQEWKSLYVDMMMTTEFADGIPFRIRFQMHELGFNEYTNKSWVHYMKPNDGFPAAEIFPGAFCKLTLTAVEEAVKFRLNNIDIVVFEPSVLSIHSSRNVKIINDGGLTSAFLYSVKFSAQ